MTDKVETSSVIPKGLKKNIIAEIEQILKSGQVKVFGNMAPLKGNQDTIQLIRQEINDWKEFKQAHPQLRIKFIPVGKLNQMYKITFIGRNNTFYQDRKINAFMFIPDSYPNAPPRVVFETVTMNGKESKFEHMNVYSSGELCQQIIKNKFNSTIHLKDLLRTIEETIYNPNQHSPADFNLSLLYRSKDKQEYDDKLKDQIKCLDWADESEL